MAWVDKYAGLQDGYDSYLLCLFTQSVLEPPIQSTKYIIGDEGCYAESGINFDGAPSFSES